MSHPVIPEIFRLGVAQMTSVEDVDANLTQMKKLYERAASERADLVVFPENSLYFRIHARSPMKGLEWGGREMRALQDVVNREQCPLMVTTPVQSPDHGFFNATLLLRSNSPAEKLYTKIHLFDVDVSGAPPVRESAVFEAGTSPRLIELKGWKLGLSICYDLRFAELYLAYAQKADLILVPSAFLVPTGQAHWHVLLRARAIETQCFVAAPAQSGEHRTHSGEIRTTFGHAMVVSPWGKILLEMDQSPDICVMELNRKEIENVRRQIPMSSHRRL